MIFVLAGFVGGLRRLSQAGLSFQPIQALEPGIFVDSQLEACARNPGASAVLQAPQEESKATASAPQLCHGSIFLQDASADQPRCLLSGFSATLIKAYLSGGGSQRVMPARPGSTLRGQGDLSVVRLDCHISGNERSSARWLFSSRRIRARSSIGLVTALTGEHDFGASGAQDYSGNTAAFI